MYRKVYTNSGIKGNLQIRSCILLMIFSSSCSTNDKNDVLDGDRNERKDISVYFQQNGSQTVDISADHIVVSCEIRICKSSQSEGDTLVRLKAWSDSELEAYNLKNTTDYQLLPENFYLLNSPLTFKADEKQKSAEIQFKSSDIFEVWKEKQPRYVLPLRLESTSAKVQEEKQDLLLMLDINAAIIKLESISGKILLNQEEVTKFIWYGKQHHLLLCDFINILI